MLVLLIHAAVTYAMLGVILIVQVVHYPLFRRVGSAQYPAYHRQHMRRITWIVAPLMTVELLTAIWLVWQPPPPVPGWQVWMGLALVGLIWGTTGMLQVPLHQSLAGGFDRDVHRRRVPFRLGSVRQDRRC
jgi:hypothetical protein